VTKNEVKQLFVDDVEERRNKIRAYIMDETIPYEDRKEVWLETPDHLMTEDGSVINLWDYEQKHGEIDWYGGLYKERYQTVDLRQCIERSYFETEEQIDDFVSNCIKLGYHSFYYDW
jgi:hypothetical protein